LFLDGSLRRNRFDSRAFSILRSLAPLLPRRRIPCTFAPLFLNSRIGPVFIITGSQASKQAGLYIIIIITTTTTTTTSKQQSY
jgi:hypothetical protein